MAVAERQATVVRAARVSRPLRVPRVVMRVRVEWLALLGRRAMRRSSQAELLREARRRREALLHADAVLRHRAVLRGDAVPQLGTSLRRAG